MVNDHYRELRCIHFNICPRKLISDFQSVVGWLFQTAGPATELSDKFCRRSCCMCFRLLLSSGRSPYSAIFPPFPSILFLVSPSMFIPSLPSHSLPFLSSFPSPSPSHLVLYLHFPVCRPVEAGIAGPPGKLLYASFGTFLAHKNCII
jgi:hypothetical protein